MNHLSQSQMLDLVLDDLKAWLDNGGDQSDDSLVYAYNNGYELHAANLWLGSGACSEEVLAKVKSLKISNKAEMKEIKQLCKQAHIYVCPDCNHHAFLDSNDGPTIRCSSCLKTAVKEGA